MVKYDAVYAQAGMAAFSFWRLDARFLCSSANLRDHPLASRGREIQEPAVVGTGTV